jgi:hypothetical protein
MSLTAFPYIYDCLRPAWLGLIGGAKIWFAVAPGQLSPVEQAAAAAQSPMEWLNRASARTSHVHLKTEAPRRTPQIQVCVQHAGEIIYLPRWWHHATINLGASIAFGGQSGPTSGVLLDGKTSADIEIEIETNPSNRYLHELLLAKAAEERFAAVDAGVETDPFNAAALATERFRLRRFAALFQGSVTTAIWVARCSFGMHLHHGFCHQP